MYIHCLYYSYSPGFCSLLLPETRPELEGHLLSPRMAVPQTDLEAVQQSKCIRMHLQVDPASSLCPNLLTWCWRDPVLFQLRTADLLKANPEKGVNSLFWIQYTKLTCKGITCVEQRCSNEGHGLDVVNLVVFSNLIDWFYDFKGGPARGRWKDPPSLAHSSQQQPRANTSQKSYLTSHWSLPKHTCKLEAFLRKSGNPVKWMLCRIVAPSEDWLKFSCN